MRLRNKKWAGPWLEAHADLVINQQTATDLKGKWETVFPVAQPIQIEVGTGKGRFIIGMAKNIQTLTLLVWKFKKPLLR
ncbi:tRNA (guanine-N(7)-)-methyltransferase [Weissella viridescens]|uniref:tRNA (Guanine-N(7)-)-methyltransferase n=1 Tax=Weissella viridescens TaxID=1629 RepID=A0A380P258_WEIVI|nr:tRNA (guanine-N(7)-)-methyltransferase [Weissella viridescens]